MTVKLSNGSSKIPRAFFAAVLLAVPALSQYQPPPAYTISTVAGTGTAGYAGDGGAGTAAQFNVPCGVAVDRSGTIYIADTANDRVRKLSSGTISLVAGSGTAGHTGDGSSATGAELQLPSAVIVDSSGNLYIADTSNHAVRKVSGGNITAVAGTGALGFSGDGAAATAATLSYPAGLAFDASGNLYIADTGNSVIRKVDSSGNISTIAGNSFFGYTGDGGPATSAELALPLSITFDAAGNLYIADPASAVVRRVAPGGTITTVAGNGTQGYSGDGGPATAASLFYPRSVAVDAAGNLFIADDFNSRIRVVLADGTIVTVAGNGSFGDSGEGGPATTAALKFPSSIALDSSGNIYLADSQNNKIKVLKPVTLNNPSRPVVSANGIISATAFGAAAAAAPGSWVEIYGANLASSTRGWTSADFTGNYAPFSLDGTNVSLGGQPAFVAYVSPSQVNVQIPHTVSPGKVEVTVTTPAGTSAPVFLTVNQVQPGLYAPPSLKIGGKQYVAAFLTDGAYALPAGAVPGLDSRPARPGDVLVLYGIGFGPVLPSPGSGQLAQELNVLTTPFEMFFETTPATRQYWGLAPGAVGLYQFNLVVPNVPAGDAVPFSFNLNGNVGTQTLYIAVGN